MSHIRNNNEGRLLQQDYLISEKKERQRLTEQFVDDNYTWDGGFDQ
jgi:hypothetical protein